MLKIGITGGIGSGKSTAARFFEALGVPLYDADQRAKWLMQNDHKLQQDLIAAFGPDTYNPAGGSTAPIWPKKYLRIRPRWPNSTPWCTLPSSEIRRLGRRKCSRLDIPIA